MFSFVKLTLKLNNVFFLHMVYLAISHSCWSASFLSPSTLTSASALACCAVKACRRKSLKWNWVFCSPDLMVMGRETAPPHFQPTALRIRHAYPGSRIPLFIHPGSRIQQQHQKSRGKTFLSYLFCSHKYHKFLKFYCWIGKENFCSRNTRVIGSTCTQKFVIKLSKYGFGIRDPRSGIQGQKGTGSRIRIRNTAAHDGRQTKSWKCYFRPVLRIRAFWPGGRISAKSVRLT